MEKFYTIQGEGYYSGQPFYFIRLGGCDVGCHWCDVKESWDHNQHQFIEVDDLLKDVKGVSEETTYSLFSCIAIAVLPDIETG